MERGGGRWREVEGGGGRQGTENVKGALMKRQKERMEDGRKEKKSRRRWRRKCDTPKMSSLKGILGPLNVARAISGAMSAMRNFCSFTKRCDSPWTIERSRSSKERSSLLLGRVGG